MARSLANLQQEATELGIQFEPEIKATELQKLIDMFYETQETSQAELEATIDKIEKAETKQEMNIHVHAVEAENRARATKVVIINDNDNRVNNVTTLATVNCSNQFFDLGTVRIPLNEPVEIMQGHLNVLREIRIPQHIQDATSGLSKVVLRPRYSIQEVDKKA